MVNHSEMGIMIPTLPVITYYTPILKSSSPMLAMEWKALHNVSSLSLSIPIIGEDSIVFTRGAHHRKINYSCV